MPCSAKSVGPGSRLAARVAALPTSWTRSSARSAVNGSADPEPAGNAGPRFGPPESYTPKHLAEKILTSKTALEGERKQVTVLFADLKGSMELLADRDPEEARKLLDPVLERMMEAVHRYEGTVNQVMGDGIMALFGAPLAHEDHAVRACYAALRMQDSVKQYAEGVRRAEGVLVQIRVGLNSGEVVVRSIGSDLHMDYTAVGQTTHLAGRMEQMAAPGSILLTAEVLRLAEGYVGVTPLGPMSVKGLGAPDRGLRGDRRGTGPDAAPGGGRPGVDHVRRPGPRGGATSPGARARGRRARPGRGPRRGAGRGEVPARLGGDALPSQRGLAHPPGQLGLVWAGDPVSARDRPAQGVLPDRGARRPATDAREGDG